MNISMLLPVFLDGVPKKTVCSHWLPVCLWSVSAVGSVTCISEDTWVVYSTWGIWQASEPRGKRGTEPVPRVLKVFLQQSPSLFCVCVCVTAYVSHSCWEISNTQTLAEPSPEARHHCQGFRFRTKFHLFCGPHFLLFVFMEWYHRHRN